MKKYLIIVLAFMLLPAVLMGCQSSADSTLNYGDITEVRISESTGFAKVDPNYFEIYQDEDSLLLFTDLLKNASKEEGIVDMIKPEYDLKILYKDENDQGFHLWVGESGEKSALMKVDDTHTIYTVSAEATDKLIALFE